MYLLQLATQPRCETSCTKNCTCKKFLDLRNLSRNEKMLSSSLRCKLQEKLPLVTAPQGCFPFDRKFWLCNRLEENFSGKGNITYTLQSCPNVPNFQKKKKTNQKKKKHFRSIRLFRLLAPSSGRKLVVLFRLKRKTREVQRVSNLLVYIFLCSVLSFN